MTEGKLQCVPSAVRLTTKSAFKSGEAAASRNCTVSTKAGSRKVPAAINLPIPRKLPAAAPTAGKKIPSTGCFASTAARLCKAMLPSNTVGSITSKTAATQAALPLDRLQEAVIKVLLLTNQVLGPIWEVILDLVPEDSRAGLAPTPILLPLPA